MSDGPPLEQEYLTILMNVELGTTLAYQEPYNEEALTSIFKNFFNMGERVIKTAFTMLNSGQQLTLNAYEWHQVPYSIQVQRKD